MDYAAKVAKDDGYLYERLGSLLSPIFEERVC